MGASKDDYQSAQKALTERRGIKLSAAHVAFTACCCAFASQCAKKPMLAYTAAGIGCGLMVLGRCGTTYYLLLTAYYLLLTTCDRLLTTHSPRTRRSPDARHRRAGVDAWRVR